MTQRWRKRAQRGQAMTEYALLVSALALALFLPVFPHPDNNERMSVMMIFVEVFDIYIDSFHTVITLPVP